MVQRKYVLDFLFDSRMLGSRPSIFPMEQHLHLHPFDGTPLSDPAIYRHFISRLLYLIVTQPNIQYAINTLSQFMNNPHLTH